MITIINHSSEKLRRVTGYVTEIERYAIHDGLGIRTTVFLKGCPLRCRWCSNPETQNLYPELGIFDDKCIHCAACLNDCPYGAVKADVNGQPYTEREFCMHHCYAKHDVYPCTGHCYTGARKMLGEKRTAWDVIQLLAKDRGFFDRSNGGMTLSGGEPMAQPDFAYALARLCKENWIHTAIETCGAGCIEDYETILPYLDMVFIDVKGLNPVKYKAWIGTDPERQMAVVRRLSELCSKCNIRMITRTPIIPGFNDTEEEVEQLAIFLKEINVQGAELLPYHRLGRGKYASMGLEYGLMNAAAPTEDKMIRLNQIMEAHLIPVYHY